MNSPQKFLLVQLGRLGDFILATPILRALKQDNPQHQIHVLASRHNALLARDHPLVDKVLIHSKKVPALLPLLLRFKCEQYDYWIDPKDHFSRESYFFARWARARCKIGFNPEGKRPAFDVTVPSAQANYEDQVAVRNLRALQSLPLQSADPRPVLFLKPRDEENLQEFLRQANLSRYVCVHLSASKEIRYWPQAHWIAFLQAVSLPAFSFVVTCSPADAARAQEIVATVPRTWHYRATSFSALFSAVKHAELVISPDTAVVHVAAAFDRPLLGLYSHEEWNLKKFRPLSTHHRVARPEEPGAFVRDIPVAVMLRQYHALAQEAL